MLSDFRSIRFRSQQNLVNLNTIQLWLSLAQLSPSLFNLFVMEAINPIITPYSSGRVLSNPSMILTYHNFEQIIVASWGIRQGKKDAFRPAMNLSSGELSNLEGPILMMTATASSSTMRILQKQFPEISKWKNILTSPIRSNVTMVIPPPGILSSKVENLLSPFIDDMRKSGRVYLVIVRGNVKS